MSSKFPHLANANNFPGCGNVDPFAFENTFDYYRWDAGTKLKLCNVNWCGDYENVVKFEDDAARDSYFDGITGDTVTLEAMIRALPGQSVKLPLPFDELVKFNYLVVDFATATSAGKRIDFETSAHVKRFHYFIDSVEYAAPNTTSARITLDVWTTFINKIDINYMLLERGHAPMAAVTVDEYLKNPIANNKYLIADDFSAGEPAATASGEFVPFGSGEKYMLIATTFPVSSLEALNEASGPVPTTSGEWAYSDIEEHRWGDGAVASLPGDAYAGGGDAYVAANLPNETLAANAQDGIPTNITMFAVKAADAYAGNLFETIRRKAPQFFEQIAALFVVDASMLELGTAHELFDTTFYEVRAANKKLANLNLTRADFGYPVEYENIAKLYTYPYASLEVSDDSGAVATIKIEDTGVLAVYQRVSLAYPFIKFDAFLDGVGGNQSVDYEWRSVNGEDVAATIHLNREDSYNWDFEFPTYALYQNAYQSYKLHNYNGNNVIPYINDVQGHLAASAGFLNAWDNANDSAVTANENANSNATTAQANANASAEAANANALANAATANENANASATTSYNNSFLSANTAQENANNNALVAFTNANGNAATALDNANNSANNALKNSKLSADTALENSTRSIEAARKNATRDADTAHANTARDIDNSRANADRQVTAIYAGLNNTNAQANRENALATAAAQVGGYMELANQFYDKAQNIRTQAAALEGSRALASFYSKNPITGLTASFSFPVQSALSTATVKGGPVSMPKHLRITNASQLVQFGPKVAGQLAGNLFSASALSTGQSFLNSFVNNSVLGVAMLDKDYAYGAANAVNTFRKNDRNQLLAVERITSTNNAITRQLNEATLDLQIGANLAEAKNSANTLLNVADANQTAADANNDANLANSKTNISNTATTDTANATATKTTAYTTAENDSETTKDNAARSNSNAVANATRNRANALEIAARDNTTAKSNAKGTKDTAIANAKRSLDTANANAKRSLDTAIANAERSYNNSVKTAAATLKTTVANATETLQRQNYVERAGMSAKIEANEAAYLDKLMDPAIKIGSYSGDATSDAFRWRGLTFRVKTQRAGDLAQAGDFFSRYGYALNQQWKLEKWQVMKYFTYWKTRDVWLVGGAGVIEGAQNTVKSILTRGVTVWADPDAIGAVSIHDNFKEV